MWGGLVLAMPVIMWQVWRFIVPALKAKEKRYAVPFILTSGYSERDLRELEGASAPVVQKPWTFADLARVVQRTLADRQPP